MTVANVFLSFQGVGFASGRRHSFDVMVGDNPPTISGGYAKWSAVPRPLQRSLTIFQGYDPAQMTVEVRFGRWDANGAWLGTTGSQQDAAIGAQIEKDIGWLEWMAGSNFQSGPSPAVYVWSHGSKGVDTDLIPPQYTNIPWIVTGLTWNKALRNPNGYRVWQDATIVLQHYLNLDAAPAPDTNAKGNYFVSKPGRDTALLIAGAPTVQSPLVDHRVLAGRICEDSKNNPCKGTSIRLNGKHLSFPVRHGVSVFVPAHQSL